ncbi:glycosyl transferase [Opitutus sp. ER46]|nr:glycosyl transferase [Opitutus sp. ER46]
MVFSLHSIAASVIGVCALSTYLLLFPCRAVLRGWGIVDKPNARSSHTVPTVRGGGVAIVAVVSVVMAWLWFRAEPIVPGLMTGEAQNAGAQGSDHLPAVAAARLLPLLALVVVLAIVSFIDDLRGLPARLRFGVHGATALIAVSLLTHNLEPITVGRLAFGLVATVWVAGYTNAFNFMDGINGIAGMQGLVTGLGTAAVAVAAGVPPAHPAVLLALAAAGACLGFLPHNFPRARVFMGDVSSAALGFLLAALAVWIAWLTSPWMLFWLGLLHANFVLDTGVTLVRRALRGDKLSEAHREHFYQRLIRAGYSHPRVTLLEAALQVVTGLALWLGTPASLSAKLVIAAAVVVLWGAFFGYAESVFRRVNAAPAA